MLRSASLSLSSPDPTRKGERHRGPSIVFNSPPSCCSSTCPLVRRLRRCIERDATGQRSQRPLLIIVAVAVVVCDHRFPSSSSSRTPFRAETSVPVQQHIVVKVGPSGKTSRDSSRPPRRRSDIAQQAHASARPTAAAQSPAKLSYLVRRSSSSFASQSALFLVVRQPVHLALPLLPLPRPVRAWPCLGSSISCQPALLD